MTGASHDGRELLARIPEEWRRPTIEIAETLRGAGHRAWIVGGGVRDLVLERPIKDIDLVSAARPEEVEALFEKTVAVGRSFGIVVVVLDGRELEVATFRKERGYSDRRRPDEVEFAASPEVDARRRDFTCNALFLDPLTGEIDDPTDGLADLRARVLRAVGDPVHRFREDGLRLLRMARFAASLGLEPADGLLRAASAERDSIVGVSPERVLDELAKILRGADPARALELLDGAGVAEICVPAWTAGDARGRLAVLAALEQMGLGEATRVERGVVPVLSPWPLFPHGREGDPESPGPSDVLVDRLVALRASRDLMQKGRARHALARHIVEASADPSLTGAEPPLDAGFDQDVDPRGELGSAEARGRLAELGRDPAFDDAFAIASAAVAVDGATPGAASPSSVAAFGERVRRCGALAPAEPFQVSTQAVIDAGVAPGPELGVALRRLRHAALGGAFSDQGGALAWFRAHLR